MNFFTFLYNDITHGFVIIVTSIDIIGFIWHQKSYHIFVPYLNYEKVIFLQCSFFEIIWNLVLWPFYDRIKFLIVIVMALKILPFVAATWSGLSPLKPIAFILAPWEISNFAIFTVPAQIGSVWLRGINWINDVLWFCTQMLAYRMSQMHVTANFYSLSAHLHRHCFQSIILQCSRFL